MLFRYVSAHLYTVQLSYKAWVDAETGEQYFSPKTVENLHQLILGKAEPVRTIETPVFNFA